MTITFYFYFFSPVFGFRKVAFDEILWFYLYPWYQIVWYRSYTSIHTYYIYVLYNNISWWNINSLYLWNEGEFCFWGKSQKLRTNWTELNCMDDSNLKTNKKILNIPFHFYPRNVCNQIRFTFHAKLNMPSTK